MKSMKSLSVIGAFILMGFINNNMSDVLSPNDMIRYLTQSRCPNGQLPTECDNAVSQRVEDSAHWRKHDYGFPVDGYQAQDAALSTDGTYIVNTWSHWPPWGNFRAEFGDGGEIYQIKDGKAKTLMTRDGGTPRDQYFCGTVFNDNLPIYSTAPLNVFPITKDDGTGWLLFDNQPPTGSWKSTVTWLNISADRVSCPSPLNPSLTRWRRENLTIPFNLLGVKKNLTLSCIIYEHFNGSTVANALEMEQAIWCKDWGRVWFAAYKTNGEGAEVFGYRLPKVIWPGPSERLDLKLADARLSTNIQPNISKSRQIDFGWPPVGYRP